MSTKAIWRKAKNGKWVVFGPVAHFDHAKRYGGTVTVSKKSGETSEVWIDSYGKPFSLKGLPHCYAYPAEKVDASAGRTYQGRRECDECGEYVDPGTSCWETGMLH